MTPNRPEATCLIAERRSGSMQAVGVLAALAGVGRPPSRFIAMARVSWASRLIEP